MSQRHLPMKTRQTNSEAKHQTTYSIRIRICKSTPGRISFELLRPCGGAATSGDGGEPPKYENGLKEWIRNKLKALASLLGQLGIKAAEALPGIIGGIISWILNRAKDVVGWVSQIYGLWL